MNLLVIDDEIEICNIFVKAFRDMNVFTASTGASGIQALKKEKPRAVILDLQLPDIHGIELLRQIRQIDGDVPVIILTGYGSGDSVVEAMKLGAYDFLNKPFDLAAVRSMIKRIDGEFSAKKKGEPASRPYDSGPIVGRSASLIEAYKTIGRAAGDDVTIFIYGETGTGKELVASLIHARSGRREGSFVPVDCTTLSKGLFESQLFGHEKGAFTGADSARGGLFESAAGGTLFLDEIGNLDLDMQAKLLRVIQEKAFFPVGSTKKVEADVRIIAATNREPEEAVQEGVLRRDLYYRLNVIPIYLAPLRERKEDITMLVEHFFRIYSGKPRELSDGAAEVFLNYRWPGNVRELENAVKHLAVSTLDGFITPDDLPEKFLKSAAPEPAESGGADSSLNQRVDRYRKEIISEALAENGWNQQKTAGELKMSVRSLRHYIEKFGLKKG